MLFLQLADGSKVGRQIGAAEAEDGLLRIADHEKTSFPAFDKYALEDTPLQRIGILKLIDNRVAVAFAQHPKQRIGARIGSRIKPFSNAHDHIFETLQAAFALHLDEVCLKLKGGMCR